MKSLYVWIFGALLAAACSLFVWTPDVLLARMGLSDAGELHAEIVGELFAGGGALENLEVLPRGADAAQKALEAGGLEAGQLSDPWGREYVYEVAADGRAFLYSTRGRDGRVGGLGVDEDLGYFWGPGGGALVHDAWPALTLAALFCAVPAPPEEDDPYRDALELRGDIERVTISPAGALWMGSSRGELFRSRDRGASWQRVATGARSSKSSSSFERVRSDRLRFVTFFGPRTAIVAGVIGEQYNQVLRTTDGGQSWASVGLPGDVRVSDVCTLGGGSPLGWLAGSNGTLLVTEDAGATWRALATPFDERQALVGVSFHSAELGVVVGRDSGLALTRDGGATWSFPDGPALESSEETGDEFVFQPAAPRRPRIRLVGDRIVFDADGALFVAELAEPLAWEPLVVGEESVQSYAVTDEGLVVLLDSGRLAVLDKRFDERPLAPKSVTGKVRAMAASTDFAGFLMQSGEFAVLDANGWHQGPLRGVLARSWEVRALDRAGDMLVATSASSLFVSPDLGQRWRRIGPSHGGRVFAREGGGQVVFGARLDWQLELATEVVTQVDGLEDFAAGGVVRRGARWLAWGTEQKAGADGHRVVSTHTPSVGDEFTGFVACSLDEGRSWTVVDRVPGAGIAALQWTDDDRLELLLASGEFRRGELELDAPGQPRASLQTVGRQPRIGWMGWLFFADEREGWAGGRRYYGGGDEYHTEDGGRHWSLVPGGGEASTEIFRMGDGLWVKFEFPRSFFAWRDGWSMDFPQLPGGVEVALDGARRAADGGLLVRLEGDGAWSLAVGAEGWQPLFE